MNVFQGDSCPESLFERVGSSSWTCLKSSFRRVVLEENRSTFVKRHGWGRLVKKWKSAGDFYENRFQQQNFKKPKLESSEKLNRNPTVSRAAWSGILFTVCCLLGVFPCCLCSVSWMMLFLVQAQRKPPKKTRVQANILPCY